MIINVELDDNLFSDNVREQATKAIANVIREMVDKRVNHYIREIQDSVNKYLDKNLTQDMIKKMINSEVSLLLAEKIQEMGED